MTEYASPVLLADPSACLRYQVLVDIYFLPKDHPEVIEVASLRERDPVVAHLMRTQQPDGCWTPELLSEGWGGGSRIIATAFALARLGYMGLDRTHPSVERGAEFLYSQQRMDGSWDLHREGRLLDHVSGLPEESGYSMIPLQTSMPLRGLAACGYAEDPRSEKAYDWLIEQCLPDGAWPTGIASGVFGYVAGYRRLPHSRWGCRSNTTGALICLAHHPTRRKSIPARKALDHLLGRETKEKQAVGFEVARMVGAENIQGFISYFARFDLGLILDLSWRVGASDDDERVAGIVKFILDQKGPMGLWTYPSRPQVTRWVSLDLARSLSRIVPGDWQSAEPRTPFQPYPKRQKRF